MYSGLARLKGETTSEGAKRRLINSHGLGWGTGWVSNWRKNEQWEAVCMVAIKIQRNYNTSS